MNKPLWDENKTDLRMSAIGQNGNTGEHYKTRYHMYHFGININGEWWEPYFLTHHSMDAIYTAFWEFFHLKVDDTQLQCTRNTNKGLIYFTCKAGKVLRIREHTYER